MITKEEALHNARAIREVCQDVYNKGLKGEDVIGPLSDIYQKANDLDGYINSLPDPAPATPPATTGA